MFMYIMTQEQTLKLQSMLEKGGEIGACIM